MRSIPNHIVQNVLIPRGPYSKDGRLSEYNPGCLWEEGQQSGCCITILSPNQCSSALVLYDYPYQHCPCALVLYDYSY